MKRYLKLVATLSLIIALGGIMASGVSFSQKSEKGHNIARNWDPGEYKPPVILG